MSTAAAVLACALGLLGRSADRFHPIVLLDDRPAGLSADADAFAGRDPDVIYVLTRAPAFTAARWAEEFRGPCWDRQSLARIASIVVHEEWHLVHGSDERGAYEAQLTALALLGYKPDSRLHQSVKRAMRAALDRSRRTALARAQTTVR